MGETDGSEMLMGRIASGPVPVRFAEPASIPQPAVTPYESGGVAPTRATPGRPVAPSGSGMGMENGSTTSLRASVLAARRAINELAGQRGLSNVRLFGSVARGEDGPESDIDLIVDPTERTSLFDTIGFASDVENLLGFGRLVDVTSSRVLPSAPPEAVTL